MKIKWKVAPAPTGRYRSFEKRSWPSAEYSDGSMCAWISEVNGKEYRPAAIKNGESFELKLTFASYTNTEGNCPWKRLSLKQRFTCVEDAKAALQKFLEAHPEHTGEHNESL